MFITFSTFNNTLKMWRNYVKENMGGGGGMFNTLKTKDKIKSGLCFVNNYGKIMAKNEYFGIATFKCFLDFKKTVMPGL